MSGKVSGSINGVGIDGADLHTYVATEEGRSYTGLTHGYEDIVVIYSYDTKPLQPSVEYHRI